jgi:hypothetical protein
MHKDDRFLYRLILLLATLGGLTIGLAIGPVLAAQDTLSAQVLRLLDRVNTWSVAQTFAVDIQISTVNTAAPAGTDCDAAGEVGKYYWDSTNDNLYICSGASGWRKITTVAP